MLGWSETHLQRLSSRGSCFSPFWLVPVLKGDEAEEVAVF
jgi:hypothetical protein